MKVKLLSCHTVHCAVSVFNLFCVYFVVSGGVCYSVDEILNKVLNLQKRFLNSMSNYYSIEDNLVVGGLCLVGRCCRIKVVRSCGWCVSFSLTEL